MNGLRKLASPIRWIGEMASWLVLATVLVTFAVVFLRYGFGVGSILLQSSITYVHALGFMLAMAYTLQMNGHVRVDVLYRRFTRHQQARVDLLGGVFLLVPMMGFIVYASWDYVLLSWRIGEGSNEAGALAAVYVLKTAILIMPLLVLLQWLASLPDLLAQLRAPDGPTHQAEAQPMPAQERL